MNLPGTFAEKRNVLIALDYIQNITSEAPGKHWTESLRKVMDQSSSSQV